jgi:dTDP-4-amino-4,6-dideoxygalactose transaminase
MVRQQLPVYSPISLRSLADGWNALFSASDAGSANSLLEVIRDKYGAKEVLLTDSGTSALTLAIAGLCRTGTKPLIALPAYCCYDIATAAVGADIQVVAYDIHPRTLGPDLDSLKTAASYEPAAVVIAHLYGIPVDLRRVQQICEAEDIPVIEDAAQGHGAGYAGRPLGSWGSVSILSFGRGKGVTGGAGGALLALDDRGRELARDANRRLEPPSRGTRELIAAFAQWILARPAVYSVPASLPFLKLGETIYRPPRIPRQISRAAEAVLSRNWCSFETESELRKSNAARLQRCAGECKGVETIETPLRGEAGYLRFPVVVASGTRSSFDSPKAQRLGITPAYPKPLVGLSHFTDRCVNRGDEFPGARLLAQRLFTIPTHSKLSAADLRSIETLLRAAH